MMIRMITGGARSGKSTFAEKLLQESNSVLYIATAKVEDVEMENRVRLHRDRRPETWGLYEGDSGLANVISNKYDCYLLDCITVMCSNYLFSQTKDLTVYDQDDFDQVELAVKSELMDFVQRGREEKKTIHLVTNEIGYSPVPMDPLTRGYRDLQGRINQMIASISDEVYLVVSSIPVKIK